MKGFVIARAVNFNWIITDQADHNLKRRCIELEYELRPKLTRFLLDHFEAACGGDFSSFHFDVEVASGYVTFSQKTPEKFRLMAARAFDLQINGAAAKLRGLAS